jgi:putative membrane protein
MMDKLSILLVCGFLTASAAAEQPPERETTAFIESAIEGHIAEVRMGKLAGERSAADEVIELAAMIVADHTNALDKLTSIAGEMDVTAPVTPSSTAQGTYNSLAQLSGIAFDRQFDDIMVQNHEATITRYRSYLQAAGGGSEVAAYAEDMLPTLERHLEKARSLQGNAP